MREDAWTLKGIGDFIYLLDCHAPNKNDVLQRRFKKDMDYNAVGGAPMLGVQGAVVKAHGSSGDVAIMNAIRQAREMLEGDVVGKISEGLSGLVDDINNQ